MNRFRLRGIGPGFRSHSDFYAAFFYYEKFGLAKKAGFL